ncbi:MAG: hypothetical protein ACI82Z_000403 [Cellvibrionaceae bacterium]|jgi:hypothetical protein
MYKNVLKLALTAFITGLFAALATTVYSLAFSQVSTDEPATQQAKIIHLLGEISRKLGEGEGINSGISTRSLGPDMGTEPIDIGKLNLDYEKPQSYARLFGFGPKLYKTSVYVTDLEKANLVPEDIVKVHWIFSNGTSTTLKNQPLFLSKISSPFDITAEVWFNNPIAGIENINNPVVLKSRIQL